VELRRLDAGSEPDLRLGARIFCAAPQYMQETFGRLPTEADGRRFVTHVPADSRREEILVFAAFEQQVALGLIQVQRRYIHPHRANIGLLLVDPAHRRQGHGSAMLRRLSELTLEWTATTHFAVSVLDNNTAGLAFWRNAGFKTLVSGFAEPGYQTGLTVMERLARLDATAPGAQVFAPTSAGCYTLPAGMRR
jgi:ribosomal protein S18 acetylase RimI-like enzyme